jgi:hypothetical protein
MAIRWGLTIDCADPARLAEFWVLALGYEPAPPPSGFASWDEWYNRFGVPEDERGLDTIADPDGVGPRLWFQQVPEPKTVKNRLHLDIPVGGGRDKPWRERWPLVTAAAERLIAAGATVVQVHELEGAPDHIVLADPEGNEFCLV